MDQGVRSPIASQGAVRATIHAMDAMGFHGSPVATWEVMGRPQVSAWMAGQAPGPVSTSGILPVMLWHHVGPLSSFAQLPNRWRVQPIAANRKCWKLSSA